jgi:hypothetical protein
MTEKFQNYLIENLIAFVSVFSMAYVMMWVGTCESSGEIMVKHYLYLPLGAKILMYLLFGYRVFPGVIAACFAAGIVLMDSWGGNLFIGMLSACAGAVAPILAMAFMNLTQVSNFSNLSKIDFRHVLFLVVFTSVIAALLKFFVYMQDVTLNINSVTFITHYITGDVVGGLIVIYLTLGFIAPIIERSYMKKTG